VIRCHMRNLPTVKINRIERRIIPLDFRSAQSVTVSTATQFIGASLPPPGLRACLDTRRRIVLRLKPGGKNGA
jgi:hypothetical protein